MIWKLRAGDQTAYAYYVILFSGDVQGLTTDSPVYYRGLRVGRVADIALTSRVDVQRSTGRERLSEKIQVTVAVDSHIDIRERSYAVFEKPFIAGAAFVQIVGRVDVDQIKPKKKLGDKPYPEIREGASFLQVTSTSAQELLSKAGTTVDRLNELLNPDNIQAVSDSLRNLNTTLAGTRQAGRRHPERRWPSCRARSPSSTRPSTSSTTLADSLSLVAMELGPQDAATKKALAGKEPSELRKTLVEARVALDNIDGAAGQLNKLVGDSKGPHPAVLRERPGRAVAGHPRAAPAHLQPQRHRHQARARSGELRVQRQAGIHAQMIPALAASAARRPPCCSAAAS